MLRKIFLIFQLYHLVHRKRKNFKKIIKIKRIGILKSITTKIDKKDFILLSVLYYKYILLINYRWVLNIKNFVSKITKSILFLLNKSNFMSLGVS